ARDGAREEMSGARSALAAPALGDAHSVVAAAGARGAALAAGRCAAERVADLDARRARDGAAVGIRRALGAEMRPDGGARAAARDSEAGRARCRRADHALVDDGAARLGLG